MPHIVKLTKEDQMLLLDQLALNWEYKSNKKLRNPDSINKMSEYYIDAAEKIRDNSIAVNNIDRNFFTWLKDQLLHGSSRQYNTAACQRALEICQQAARNRYRT